MRLLLQAVLEEEEEEQSPREEEPRGWFILISAHPHGLHVTPSVPPHIAPHTVQ